MRYWIIALVALAVVGGGLYYLRQNLDSIVANEIEAVGTDALGTRVHVGSVELDLRAGSGTIRDLRVENPQGFSDRRMVSIDEIALTIDVSSALAVASGSSEHVVIKRLSIRDPRVSVVTDRNGRTNLQSVQAHLGGATSSSPAGSGEASPLRISILEFAVTTGRIDADTRAVGGKQYELPLPGFRMRGVGGRAGTPPAKLAEAIGEAFATRVAAAVATRVVTQGLRRAIDQNLGGQTGEAVQGLLNRFLPKD